MHLHHIESTVCVTGCVPEMRRTRSQTKGITPQPLCFFWLSEELQNGVPEILSSKFCWREKCYFALNTVGVSSWKFKRSWKVTDITFWRHESWHVFNRIGIKLFSVSLNWDLKLQRKPDLRFPASDKHLKLLRLQPICPVPVADNGEPFPLGAYTTFFILHQTLEWWIKKRKCCAGAGVELQSCVILTYFYHGG